MLRIAREVGARRSPSTSGERDFRAQSSVVQPHEVSLGQTRGQEVTQGAPLVTSCPRLVTEETVSLFPLVPDRARCPSMAFLLTFHGDWTSLHAAPRQVNAFLL